METTGQRAGHLIQARALQLCFLTWYREGMKSSAWSKVRQVLWEHFPTATVQSREAVIRHAQLMAKEARRRLKVGPDFVPQLATDYTRLVRDRDRVR